MSDDLIQLKEEYKIYCPNCRTILANIVVTTVHSGDKIYKTRYRCDECYVCKKKSLYTKKFYGRCHIDRVANNVELIFTDSIVEDDDTITCLFKTKEVK